MFETAELGRRIAKGVYKKTEPVLRQQLLALQEQLRRIQKTLGGTPSMNDRGRSRPAARTSSGVQTQTMAVRCFTS